MLEYILFMKILTPENIYVLESYISQLVRNEFFLKFLLNFPLLVSVILLVVHLNYKHLTLKQVFIVKNFTLIFSLLYLFFFMFLVIDYMFFKDLNLLIYPILDFVLEEVIKNFEKR